MCGHQRHPFPMWAPSPNRRDCTPLFMLELLSEYSSRSQKGLQNHALLPPPSAAFSNALFELCGLKGGVHFCHDNPFTTDCHLLPPACGTGAYAISPSRIRGTLACTTLIAMQPRTAPSPAYMQPACTHRVVITVIPHSARRHAMPAKDAASWWHRQMHSAGIGNECHPWQHAWKRPAHTGGCT